MPTPEQKHPLNPFTLSEWIAATDRPESCKGSENPELPEPPETGEDLPRDCLTADTQADADAFLFPCRIDALLLGICTEGQAALTCNLREFRLRKHLLFCCPPETIVQLRPMRDFRMCVTAVSPEFLHSLPPDLTAELLRRPFDPRTKLEEADTDSLCNFVRLLEEEMHAPEQPCSRELVRNLLATLLCKTANLLQTGRNPQSHVKRTSSHRSEACFRRFLELVDEHFRHERGVGFYAQQLGLSSKYLTTLIKQVSGSSVSTWIGRRVVLEAQVLLKHSERSMQEIAAWLNFQNQSFFGSYFKRVTGLSPTRYKQMTVPK